MNELPSYDTWKLAEPPYYNNEPEIIGECCVCGCEIYENDKYSDVDGDIVCEDIVCNEYVSAYMRRFRKVGA